MSKGAPLKLYLYREGPHFQIPPELRENGVRPRTIPLFERLDEYGSCPQGRFVSVASPEEADYIVFPYVLEGFIRVVRAMSVQYFIRQLPHFLHFERKHLFFHCHDLGDPLFTDGLILTTAPDRFNVDDPFLAPLPYFPGNHVLRNAPDFAFHAIDVDTNFVGAMSGHVRYELTKSVSKEPGLRCILQHPKSSDWSSSATSYLHMKDPARKQPMEDLFIQSMRRSWTSLCPRGNGSSSIRFYETLCMGRIPVHVSDAYILPFEEDIDYREFCLFIPEAEVGMAGAILRKWLAGRSTEERMAMCRTARQVWERYFKPENEVDICLEHMRRHLPETNVQGRARYRLAPSPLAAEAFPRIVTVPGFYANMIADEQTLWCNTMPKESPAPTGPAPLLVGGIPSGLSLHTLSRLLELVREVPENASVACSGAPSGILAIALANGLVKAGNFSSLVYGMEDWDREAATPDGTPFAECACNIRAARVHDLVRLMDSGGPGAFRPESVHLTVLAAKSPDVLPEALSAWSGKLAPGGLLAIVTADVRASYASTIQFARDNGFTPVPCQDPTLIVLRKAGDAQPPAPLLNRKRRLRPVRGAARLLAVGSKACVAPPSGPSLEDQRFLAVKPTGGMGNRLLGILCAVPYSLMTGRKLYVDWSDFMYSDRGENVFPKLFKLCGVPFAYRLPQTPDVYPEFWQGNLASNALVEQIGINHLDQAVMEQTRIDLATRYPQTVATFWSFNLAPMQAALEHIQEHLPQFRCLHADGICKEVMQKHIRPRPVVSSRVDEFAARHFTGPMIGVHVRHTDLRMPLEPTLRAVYDLKKALGARIFLATDNQAVERALSRQFGDALVALPKRYPENGLHLHSHRVTGMTNFEKALDAAVEMYLLSRCDAIVRYQASTFAQISWYNSDVPVERMICVT